MTSLYIVQQLELQFLYTLSWSRVLYSTFDSFMLSGSEEDFYRNNAFHQLTIWQPQHKNPPLRVIKLTVLVHPPKLTITLYQYVLFVIMNIMNFLYMPYMAVPLPTNRCHRDHELYKLGRTILDHHYHKLSDNFIWFKHGSRVVFYKETMQMIYIFTPYLNSPGFGGHAIYKCGRSFGDYYTRNDTRILVLDYRLVMPNINYFI